MKYRPKPGLARIWVRSPAPRARPLLRSTTGAATRSVTGYSATPDLDSSAADWYAAVGLAVMGPVSLILLAQGMVPIHGFGGSEWSPPGARNPI